MDFLFRTVWPSYTTASLCYSNLTFTAHRKPAQPHSLPISIPATLFMYEYDFPN
jgi:hypothetical protein